MSTTKSKELKAALDAVAKNAINSDSKKTKEEYLKEFQEAQSAFGKKKKKFVRVKGGSELFTEDVKTKFEQERLAKNSVSQTNQRLMYIYRMKQQQKKTGKYMNIACYEKAVVRMYKDDPQYGPCVVCDYGEGDEIAQILIPYDKFTDKTADEIQKEFKISHITFLKRRINTTVDFCVEGYIPKTETAPAYFIGNRVEAMKDKCAHFWYSVEVDGSSETYRFNEGSLIEARIVGVLPRAGVLVEIFGVESLVHYTEVTYPIERDFRKVKGIVHGGTIPVKIMSLNRSEDKIEVSFIASIKRTKPDPMEQALVLYPPGAVVSGTVSMINWKDDRPELSNVIVRLPHDAEVFCRYADKPVTPGQRVTVVIGEKRGRTRKTGRPYIHARITHVENDTIMDGLY